MYSVEYALKTSLLICQDKSGGIDNVTIESEINLFVTCYTIKYHAPRTIAVRSFIRSFKLAPKPSGVIRPSTYGAHSAR